MYHNYHTTPLQRKEHLRVLCQPGQNQSKAQHRKKQVIPYLVNWSICLRFPDRVREPRKHFENYSSEMTERLAYDPSQKKGLCFKEFQISLWFDEGMAVVRAVKTRDVG